MVVSAKDLDALKSIVNAFKLVSFVVRTVSAMIVKISMGPLTGEFFWIVEDVT